MDKYKIVTTDNEVAYLEKNGQPTTCSELGMAVIEGKPNTFPCIAQCPFFIQNEDGIILDCRNRQRFIRLELDAGR